MLRVHVAASHVRGVVEQLLTPEFKQRELANFLQDPTTKIVDFSVRRYGHGDRSSASSLPASSIEAMQNLLIDVADKLGDLKI